MLRPVVSALVLVASVCLASCSPTPPEPEPEPQIYQHYVALGDSYSAMGSRAAKTTGPSACTRSADNYPNHVAEHERVENFTDVTCSSAITDHVVGTRETAEGPIAPQVDAIDSATDLVTLSIGGNDFGFPDIVSCFRDAALSDAPSNCAAQFAHLDTSDLAGKLDMVHEEIATRAPEAMVIVTGYMPLVTAEGSCDAAWFVSPADRAWAVTVTEQLNDEIRAAAQRHGALFVLPDDAPAHTACAEADQRWTDITGIATEAYPLHPTPVGQVAMGKAVAQVL
ncbi:SGNH/GDSL hydrolase family protein [Corynebacterium pilosum]|uniref:Lipase 2 n=1 Tax=Corynebacterium pilosum TaxID=35756 RepID=A0A376CPV2_9CORY|nr:SGNH/GDSL hydrolase family protein [Corynebacterium pilosum]STC70315.1 Lipase 2 precursor [Corynebacterium pilosum]